VDKVVIKLIFHDSLKAINSLPIGGAHILKYTRGGHLLFVVDKNGIRAFYAYTLKAACDIIRCDGSRIVDLVFSELDRAFAVVSTTGTIERYELPSFNKIQPVPEDYEDEKTN